MIERRRKAGDAAFCGLFAALIATGAFIRIPIPLVPITLQTFFAVLSGLVLGRRRGAISAGLYLLVGLLGIPVFTQGGGLSYILHPTFGYLIGLIPGAYLAGRLRPLRPSFPRALFACATGMLAIYLIGVPYLYFASHLFTQNPMGAHTVLFAGFLTPLPGDIVKALAAALLFTKLQKQRSLPV